MSPDSHSPLTVPASPPYDALLLVSFGGPEGPDDVLPYLENVVRGKNVPRERLLEVARHYEPFGGVSPLNAENRALLAALVGELNAHGPKLSVYWGNRNWHPMLVDAVRQMADDGVRRALALVTSPFGSYPSCRQYVEDIEHARQAVGSDAPQIEKLRLFYNHPGYIEAMADRVSAAFDAIPVERRAAARLVFTAHSIPAAMAERSPYERQLREACRLVAEQVKLLAERDETFSRRRHGDASAAIAGPQADVPSAAKHCGCACERQNAPAGWNLAFQSRSGPPSQPWLEPDVRDYLRRIRADGVGDVVLAPIGFLSENMEVVYDLDVEVCELCDALGLNLVRAEVVGSHPRFVRMVRELILERIDPNVPRLALGPDGPWPDECSADCCRPPT